MAQIKFSYENPLLALWGEDFFHTVPTHAGVYYFLDESHRPLYIGKADQLRRRIRSHGNAKPGHSPEHVLEMLEHVRDLRWEKHSSGDQALIRETQLIQSVQPPYNIAGTDPTPYLYVGLRVGERQPRDRRIAAVDFRLTHRELENTFDVYGCFGHRGKTKAGYSALLRLLYAATCPRDRFQIPSRLCRTSPAYVHRGDVPVDWLKPLAEFLRGESVSVLPLIFDRLMERDGLSPVLYGPLQRDLDALKEFFKLGPAETRRLSRRAKAKSHLLSQDQMQSLVRDKFQAKLKG